MENVTGFHSDDNSFTHAVSEVCHLFVLLHQSLLCTHLHMFMHTILCNLISCVDVWNHHHNQDLDMFHHPKEQSCTISL